MSAREKTGTRLAGIALIAVVILLGFLTIGMYNNAFTSTVPVTLQADRAGLQMEPKNRVKLDGIDVGRVSKVGLTDDGRHAQITLAMQPDKVGRIPSNVTVSLEQLTAFGNKFVNLSMPAQPSSRPLQAGSVIHADQVTVEVNELFDNLTKVLNVLHPAKVNTTLGALAQALNGRGDKLGDTLKVGSDYLKKINTDLPTIQTDLIKTNKVANLYADVTPDLLTLLDNVTVTSDTLSEKGPEFASTLLSLTTLGDDGHDLLEDNGDDLSDMLDSLRPTTRLLRKYSPEFVCLFQGAEEAHRRLSIAFGGDGPGFKPIAGIMTHTVVEPGDETYRPDQPNVLSHHEGPGCSGMPNVTKFPPAVPKGDPTAPELDPGNNAYQPGQPPLVVQLFGHPGTGLPVPGVAQKKGN
ncbi:MCE family protein [Pseudonocardia spinosispora]|uniref:MCE family protein n=1 Tax=Pseudonocardia spinosispora TaxID=103441 RepID=UPI00041B8F4E|nr:MCE family protein [Pseudonocardia spinosispora]